MAGGSLFRQGVTALAVAGATATGQLVSFGTSPTVTFGIAGQTLTASAGLNAASLTMFATGNTTQSSTGTSPVSSLIFRGGGDISVGISAGSVVVSGSQSNQNAIASNGNFNFQTLSFSNANGLSFGTSAGSAIFGSYTVPTVTNSSWSISDAATSGTVARLAFTNLNGVTLSLSSGAGGSHTIVGSHNALTSQSNQALSAANGSFAFQTASFSNVNGISFGTSAGSAITASHNALTSQSNQNVTAGNGGFAFQTLSFSNANNFSFGTSAGSAITGSFSQTNQQMTMFATGNTTQSSTGTSNASSLIFRGEGLASIGITGGSVVVSVPAGAPSPVNFSAGTTSNNLGSVVFSDSNGVSFGLNGSTITASVAAGGFTAPGHHPYDDLVNVVGTLGQGSLLFDPQRIPNVAFDRILVLLQNTNSSNSSGSHTLGFSLGMYTRNASTLSLYTSFSGSTAVTHSGTAGSYSRYSGGRLFPLTFAATTITENRYWLGFVSSTSSAGANGSYSNYLVSNIGSQYTGLFGTASNASMQNKLGQGFYSTSTTGLPASVAFSQIQGTNSNARRFPVIGFGSGTA